MCGRFGIPGHPTSHHFKADIGGPHGHMTDIPTIWVLFVACGGRFLAAQEIPEGVPSGSPVGLADLRRVAPGKTNDQHLMLLRLKSEGIAISIPNHRAGDLKGRVGFGLGLDSRLGESKDKYRQPVTPAVLIFCAVGQNRLCLKVLSIQLSGNPQGYPQVSGISGVYDSWSDSGSISSAEGLRILPTAFESGCVGALPERRGEAAGPSVSVASSPNPRPGQRSSPERREQAH